MFATASTAQRTASRVPNADIPPRKAAQPHPHALHHALASGSEPKALAAIARRPGMVNTPGERGCTALHLAAGLRCGPPVIEALLGHGADILAPRAVGRTALHHAFYGSMPVSLATLRRLLAAGGAVLRERADHLGITPLMLAAENGSVPALALLLDDGAAVDARDVGQVTALMQSAGEGYTEVVRALVNAGADVHAHGHDGRTAVHYAAACGQVDVVDILCGAAADLARNDSANALTIAVAQGRAEAAVRVQLGYFAQGVALSEKELALMASAGIVPLTPAEASMLSTYGPAARP